MLARHTRTESDGHVRLYSYERSRYTTRLERHIDLALTTSVDPPCSVELATSHSGTADRPTGWLSGRPLRNQSHAKNDDVDKCVIRDSARSLQRSFM